jgi:hypothetical protein
MSNWKPKYSGESTFKKRNHFKLKDGDVVARILPQPKGSNAEYSSDWSKYHSVQFGYKNSEGKFRPFESSLVKNNKTKMVEVPDAALDRINDLKAKLETARSEGNGPLTAKLNTLVGQKGIYNVDNNHHMNVMLLDGSIGELKIRYKAKMDLDREIKKLRSEGVDPLSFDDGRFFVFSRSGMGNDTNYKVTTYSQRVDLPDGGKAYQEVSSKVGQDVLFRLESEGFELENLYNRPTAEEVAQIVAGSDLLTGRSPACDLIFDARWKARREAAAPVGQDDNETPDDYVAPTASFTTAANTTNLGFPSTTRVIAPVVAKTATTVVTPKAAPVAAPAALEVKTQAQAVDEMSDDDFFKQIGVQTA